MRRTSRSLSVVTAVLGILLAGAADARAGLIDFIWDMSGPQMVGFTVRCRVLTPRKPHSCDLFGVTLTEQPDVMTLRRSWLSLEGGLYRSTGKNEGGIDFRAWKTEMVAFDPMVEYASDPNGKWRSFHGAGASLQFFFGDEFRRFRKTAIKTRPIALEYGDHLEVALNVRLYPDGFGADQIGQAAPVTEDRPFEWTWGISGGYKF